MTASQHILRLQHKTRNNIITFVIGENEDAPAGGRIAIEAEINEEEDPEDVPQEEPIEMEADDDGESADEEHFDITLAARHSVI